MFYLCDARSPNNFLKIYVPFCSSKCHPLYKTHLSSFKMRSSGSFPRRTKTLKHTISLYVLDVSSQIIRDIKMKSYFIFSWRLVIHCIHLSRLEFPFYINDFIRQCFQMTKTLIFFFVEQLCHIFCVIGNLARRFFAIFLFTISFLDVGYVKIAQCVRGW